MSLSAPPGLVPQNPVALRSRSRSSPDVFISNYKEEHAVQEVLNQLPARVQFNHWKRVEVDGKKKMKLLTADLEKTQFGELFRKEVKQFRWHARRVKIQYEQLKLL